MAAAAARNGAGKPKRKRARKIRTRIVDNNSSSSSSSSSSSEEESVKSESSSSDSSSEDEDIKIGSSAALRKQERKDQSMDVDSSTDSSSDSSSSSEEEDSSDEDDTQAAQLNKRSEKHLFTPPPEPLTSWPESEQAQKHLPITVEQKYQKLIAQSDEAIIEYTSNTTLMQEQRQRLEAMKRMQKNTEAQNARLGGSILSNNATSSIASNDAILDTASLAARREEVEKGWMKIMIEEYGNELDALRKKEPTLGTSDTDRRMPLLIDSLQAGAELFSDGINASLEEKRKAPKLHTIDETAIFLKGLKEE